MLDSVNYLFEQIMQRGFGGIEYDDNAALYAGGGLPGRTGRAGQRLFLSDGASSDG